MSTHQIPLDDFLRRIPLGAEVYYVGQLCDAWQMSTPGGSDAITLHLVCNGEAWVHMPNQDAPLDPQAPGAGLLCGHRSASANWSAYHRWNSSRPGACNGRLASLTYKKANMLDITLRCGYESEAAFRLLRFAYKMNF